MCVRDCVCVYVCFVIRCSQDVNDQIIAGVFICFNHLTDQAFIWDQVFNSTVVRLLQVQLLRQRKLLITAVTDSGVYLFRHCPDHFAGHSLVACPFADNSFLHFYLRLLTSLLPPSSRQPGPVAVLPGQMLKLHLIFSPISHSLGVDREMSSGCFSRAILCIFYEEI